MSDNVVNNRIIELPPLSEYTEICPDFYLYMFEDNSEYNIDKLFIVIEVLNDGRIKVVDYASQEESIIKISDLLSGKGEHWFFSDNFYKYKLTHR